MGHLLKNTSGQFIEFELRDTGNNLIISTGGLVVLVAMNNSTGYSTGSGSVGVINNKRLYYRPTQDETTGHTLRLEASHTGAATDYYDSFITTPGVDSSGYVTISNSLPVLDGSRFVTINNDLPVVDVDGFVTINNDLPILNPSGYVSIINDLPTLDASGRVTINNTLPLLDGSRHVTINNTLPTVHATGSVFTHMLPSLPEIKTQVVNALSVDLYSEPGYGIPSGTTTLAAKIGMMCKATINKSDQTAGLYRLWNFSGTTVDQQAICSDDSVIFIRNKLIAG